MPLKKPNLWKISSPTSSLWNYEEINFCLLSPLACKEIKPVNPKGSQPWILMGRTDAELKHLLRPPAVKSWFIGKDHDAGKDRGQQEEEGSGKLDSSTDSVDMSLSELQETLRGGQAWCAAVHGFAKSRAGLSDSTTATFLSCKLPF